MTLMNHCYRSIKKETKNQYSIIKGVEFFLFLETIARRWPRFAPNLGSAAGLLFSPCAPTNDKIRLLGGAHSTMMTIVFFFQSSLPFFALIKK